MVNATKTKLVLLANNLETFGGGERYIMEIISRLQKKYDITILTSRSPKDLVRIKLSELIEKYKITDVKIVYLDCFSMDGNKIGLGNFLLAIPKIGSVEKLRKIIRSTEVVYAMSVNPLLFFDSLFFSKLYGKRFILGLHNPLILRESDANKFTFGKIAQYFILKTVHEIHAQTETQVKMLRLVNYRGKVYYIPHFLYFGTHMGKDLRKKKEFTVLFVGRFDVYQKGLDLLVGIINESLKLDGGLKFVIVGSGEGRELMEQLEKDNPNNVKWYKFLEGLPLKERYWSADLFVLPSRYETPGLCLLEAQGYGMPAVAFNVQGPRDIMKDDIQGELVKPFDVVAFSKAIIKFRKEYYREGRSYGKSRVAIRKIVGERYSTEQFITRFGDMIRGSVHEKR